MFKDFSAQAFTMGVLAAFVGFASSFAVILQGLTAVGASPAEAASGLAALSIAMGILGVILSGLMKLPISIAWSTPGAALLAGAGVVHGGFGVAVGAFLVAAALVVAAGLIKPFGNLVASIPASIANAMLAGILLGLCLAPVKAVAADPMAGILIAVAWAAAGAWKRILAVPAALVMFVIITVVHFPQGGLASMPGFGLGLHFVMPQFEVAALVSVALPLFLVTMASQNIPGITVLRVNGYETAPGPLFTATGLFSMLAAPFGGLAVNLAAITAAMCAGVDAHRDPSRRYWAAIVAGVTYVIFGLFTGLITWFVAKSDPVLIEAVAGLALFGAFASSASAAFRDAETRDAAAVTFMVTASGLSFGGISGAFWGLLGGGAVMAMQRLALLRRS
jgi:benzoate membrane transport protein